MGSGCSADRYDQDEWCKPRIAKSIKRKSRKGKKKNLEEKSSEQVPPEPLSTEAQKTQLLARIPGRIWGNGSTRSACAFTQQGRKGINQDAMLVWEQFASRNDVLLCCVFDGHGPYGHLVAKKVRDALPSKLMSMWKAHMRGDTNLNNDEDGDNSSDDNDDGSDSDRDGAGEDSVGGDGSRKIEHTESAWHGSNSLQCDQNGGQPEMPSMAMKLWRECIMRTFRSMDRELRSQPAIDCFCSGTTAVVLLQQGTDLIIGNVGDSRAVLATLVHGGDSHIKGRSGRRSKKPTSKLEAVQLTIDLKPDLPREAERIRRCKGRVFAMDDEPDVMRLWLPWDDAPGLAMARAFGDFCLKDFGLIAVPDITYRAITPADQFVILATDGVWDVMTNKQAITIVAKAPSRGTAAQLLVKTAVRGWKHKYPSSKVDDCAVICLFFHHESGAPFQQDAINATSMYYYTEGDEEEHDEDDGYEEDVDEIMSMDKHRQAQVPWNVPMPESCKQHPTESEEIVCNGHGAESQSVDVHNSENDMLHPANSVHIDEASALSVTEIQEVDMGGPSSLQRKGKEEATMSPPRRSLADMMSRESDGEEGNEWSALVGVVRVNSIMNLPRFKTGDLPSMRKA